MWQTNRDMQRGLTRAGLVLGWTLLACAATVAALGFVLTVVTSPWQGILLGGIGAALTVAAVVQLQRTYERRARLKADDRDAAQAIADPLQERRTSLERQRIELRRQRRLNWSLLAVVALVVIQLTVEWITAWDWASLALAVLIGGLVGGMRMYNLQRIGPRLRQLETELSEERPLPSSHQ